MLNQILHGLNANQGTVMVILTAGYLLATILLVRHSAKQTETIRRTLDFYDRAEHNRYRPYVIFDIVYEDCIAYARMRNMGISPALDIHVSVTPCLRWNDKENGVSFIENGITFLAPNRELSEPFGYLQSLLTHYPEFRFAGEVLYKDSAGVSYRETFAIDLSYVKTLSFIGKKTVEERLEAIERRLERLCETFSHPLSVLHTSEAEYQKQEWRRVQAALMDLRRSAIRRTKFAEMQENAKVQAEAAPVSADTKNPAEK